MDHREIKETKAVSISGFVENRENTMQTWVVSSAGKFLKGLSDKYLGEAKGDAKEEAKILDAAIERFFKYVGPKELFRKNFGKAKVYVNENILKTELNQLDNFTIVEIDTKGAPKVDSDGKPVLITYSYNLKKVFGLICLATLDDEVYDEAEAEHEQNKEKRALTLFNELLWLREHPSTCHAGIRHGITFTSNHVYPGVKLIEDLGAAIQDAMVKYFEEVLAKMSPTDQFKTLKFWGAEDDVKFLKEHTPTVETYVKKFLLSNGVNTEDKMVAKNIKERVACVKELPFPATLHPLAIKLQTLSNLKPNSANQSYNDALIKAQLALKKCNSFDDFKNFGLERFVDEVDLWRRCENFSWGVVIGAEEKQLVEDANNLRKKLFQQKFTAKEEEEKELKEAKASFARSCAKFDKEKSVDFVTNFYSFWFTDAGGEIRYSLWQRLINVERSRIYLSDKDLKELPQKQDKEGATLFSPYELNRIFLHAHIVSQAEWSEKFYWWFTRARRFVKAKFEPKVGADAKLEDSLQKSSYPPALIAQLDLMDLLYVKRNATKNQVPDDIKEPISLPTFVVPAKLYGDTKEALEYSTKLFTEAKAEEIQRFIFAQNIAMNMAIPEALEHQAWIRSFDAKQTITLSSRNWLASFSAIEIAKFKLLLKKGAEFPTFRVNFGDVFKLIDNGKIPQFLNLLGRERFRAACSNGIILSNILLNCEEKERLAFTRSLLQSNNIGLQDIVDDKSELALLLPLFPKNEWKEFLALGGQGFLESKIPDSGALEEFLRYFPDTLGFFEFIGKQFLEEKIKNGYELARLLRKLPEDTRGSCVTKLLAVTKQYISYFVKDSYELAFVLSELKPEEWKCLHDPFANYLQNTITDTPKLAFVYKHLNPDNRFAFAKELRSIPLKFQNLSAYNLIFALDSIEASDRLNFLYFFFFSTKAPPSLFGVEHLTGKLFGKIPVSKWDELITLFGESGLQIQLQNRFTLCNLFKDLPPNQWLIFLTLLGNANLQKKPIKIPLLDALYNLTPFTDLSDGSEKVAHFFRRLLADKTKSADGIWSLIGHEDIFMLFERVGKHLNAFQSREILDSFMPDLAKIAKDKKIFPANEIEAIDLLIAEEKPFEEESFNRMLGFLSLSCKPDRVISALKHYGKQRLSNSLCYFCEPEEFKRTWKLFEIIPWENAQISDLEDVLPDNWRDMICKYGKCKEYIDSLFEKLSSSPRGKDNFVKFLGKWGLKTAIAHDKWGGREVLNAQLNYLESEERKIFGPLWWKWGKRILYYSAIATATSIGIAFIAPSLFAFSLNPVGIAASAAALFTLIFHYFIENSLKWHNNQKAFNIGSAFLFTSLLAFSLTFLLLPTTVSPIAISGLKGLTIIASGITAVSGLAGLLGNYLFVEELPLTKNIPSSGDTATPVDLAKIAALRTNIADAKFEAPHVVTSIPVGIETKQDAASAAPQLAIPSTLSR